MKPGLRWVNITPEQIQAEREASLRRQAARDVAPKVADNPQHAAPHLVMPRISLGGGAYIVNVKGGNNYGGGA